MNLSVCLALQTLRLPLSVCLMSKIIRADDTGTWLHHILAGNKIKTSEPRIKTKYIENEIDLVNSPCKTWTAEISGRMWSLCENVIPFAEAAAKKLGGEPNFKVRGVIHASVACVRKNEFDVYVDPTQTDPAHAVFTIDKIKYAPDENGIPSQKLAHEFVLSIAKCFSLYEPPDFHILEDGCEQQKNGADHATDRPRQTNQPCAR